MKLSDREWRVFSLTGENGLFPIEATSTGIDSIYLKRSNDNRQLQLPYITRTESNNGISEFISNDNICFGLDSGNCITIGLDTQTAYWRPFAFVTGQNIHVLRGEKLDFYAAQFMTVILRNQMKSKFNWGGNDATLGRLKRLRILLPSNCSGEPDFQFMADYIRNIMQEKQKQYLQIVKRRIKKLEMKNTGYPPLTIEGKEWKPVPIVNIFDKFVSGKGKGLNHLEQVKHGVSYISATNRNNGVSCFVKKDNNSDKMLQEGNCIGFIKNGDGSAGFAIYKQEPFISTSDVIYGYAKWLNQFTGLFFVVAQDMIERKYSHGYKRNTQHLRGDRVMLPVDDNGSPDYAFMELYGKMLVARKYQQYLDYLESRISST